MEIEIYKKVIKKYLGKYILDKIETEGESFLNLKKYEKKVSVLSIDWLPLTRIDPDVTPSNIIELLDIFFDYTIEIIIKNKGYIENIIGNSINIIFGLDDVDYITNSCKTALEMIVIEKKLNDKIKKNNFINITSGIATGKVQIGNIGSSEKLHFTALGKAMNDATRLQKMNKEFNKKILIDNETYINIKDLFNFELVQKLYQKVNNGSIDYFVYGI
jgi:adenylate cyclase